MPKNSSAAAEQASSVLGIPPSYSPKIRLHYDPEQDDVAMNRWRLENILVKIANAKDRLEIDDAFAPLGAFLAFLLALLPNDFQEFLGIAGSAWTAVAIVGAVIFGIRALGVLWQVFKLRDEPKKTPEDFVREIMQEFKERQAAYEKQHLAAIGSGASENQATQSIPDTEAPQPPQV